VHAGGEMDDDVDVAQGISPAGISIDVADGYGITFFFPPVAQRPPDGMGVLLQCCNERVADESVGACDEKFHLPANLRRSFILI